MDGSFIRIKHIVLDKDNEFICKLFLPSNLKVVDKETVLEYLSELILTTLQGIEPEEESISLASAIITNELYIDKLADAAFIEDEKIIDFRGSILTNEEAENLIHSLNNILFEIKI